MNLADRCVKYLADREAARVLCESPHLQFSEDRFDEWAVSMINGYTNLELLELISEVMANGWR